MGGPSERQVGPASITLRPAGPGDERRLRAMFAADRAVLFTGLPPDVAADLVAMQWEAQRRGHAQAFPAATTLLVVASGDVVGRLVVDWGVDPIHVVDLVVDLHVRRRGIATAVMTHVRDRAAHAGRGVTLSVARDNEPAMALYRGLGFRVVDETEVRRMMRWDAPAGSGRDDAVHGQPPGWVGTTTRLQPPTR